MRKIYYSFILLLLSFGMSSPAFSQWQNLFKKEVFITKTDSLPYRILYPKNFDTTKEYPVVFFLHGGGERGNDNELQLTNFAMYFASDSIRSIHEFIAILPQCAKGDYWGTVNRKEIPGGLEFDFLPYEKQGKSGESFVKLVHELKRKPYINKEKLYLTGMSMGGIGTVDILYRNPDLFKAALVICGGGNPNYVQNFATKVPIWFFHGDKDTIVKTDYALQLIAAIRKAGGDPKLTIYEGVGHNSWDFVPKEKGILDWLLSK